MLPLSTNRQGRVLLAPHDLQLKLISPAGTDTPQVVSTRVLPIGTGPLVSASATSSAGGFLEAPQATSLEKDSQDGGTNHQNASHSTSSDGANRSWNLPWHIVVERTKLERPEKGMNVEVKTLSVHERKSENGRLRPLLRPQSPSRFYAAKSP